ncbi:unnamed protein product [Pleuronectes platessa]|uniref:Uncharacterized protein n=1 Tax=Pleuronectes platessa TaxID=8262 RepID=A0A9N7VUK4_PLEPL|nr:unnamed protein product [Pleuronectes platessa]
MEEKGRESDSNSTESDRRERESERGKEEERESAREEYELSNGLMEAPCSLSVVGGRFNSPWFVAPGSDRTLLSSNRNKQVFPPELIVESDTEVRSGLKRSADPEMDEKPSIPNPSMRRRGDTRRKQPAITHRNPDDLRRHTFLHNGLRSTSKHQNQQEGEDEQTLGSCSVIDSVEEEEEVEVEEVVVVVVKGNMKPLLDDCITPAL